MLRSVFRLKDYPELKWRIDFETWHKFQNRFNRWPTRFKRPRADAKSSQVK